MLWGLCVYLVQTATALGKLGHKDGEVCLTKAAGKHDVIQMVSIGVKVLHLGV